MDLEGVCNKLSAAAQQDLDPETKEFQDAVVNIF